ncbi:MAG: SLBB domain-containing protein [Acidobacteria bacterium]|nr:SLBB domain-containing protein [Acidobacteriota bacterium]
MSTERHPFLVPGLLACAALWFFHAAVSAQDTPARLRTVNTAPIDPATNSSTNYHVGPGDVLLIEVAGEPDLKRKVKVTELGTIQLPYINHELKLGGLSEHQAAALLKKEFLTILKEPQVTVFIEEYNALAAGIAGAVKEPKRIALTRELRLYDLIGLAGGLTDKAGELVELVHTKGEEGIETIDLKELFRKPELNRVIRDGDLVNVPEAGVIYVTGNVKNAGPYPVKENVTLTEALAMAGGVQQDTKRKEIRLWRANGSNKNQRTEQVVSLDEIEKDPKKDILLRPYDVVLVPESSNRKQARSIVQALASGVASSLGWGILR